jgi:hypothetical protein
VPFISDPHFPDAITTSIDALGEQLAGINDSLESGASDPSQPDYYQCLETPLSSLPDHSSTESATIGEAVTQFNNPGEILHPEPMVWVEMDSLSA